MTYLFAFDQGITSSSRIVVAAGIVRSATAGGAIADDLLGLSQGDPLGTAAVRSETRATRAFSAEYLAGFGAAFLERVDAFPRPSGGLRWTATAVPREAEDREKWERAKTWGGADE